MLDFIHEDFLSMMYQVKEHNQTERLPEYIILYLQCSCSTKSSIPVLTLLNPEYLIFYLQRYPALIYKLSEIFENSHKKGVYFIHKARQTT